MDLCQDSNRSKAARNLPLGEAGRTNCDEEADIDEELGQERFPVDAEYRHQIRNSRQGP